MSSGTNYKAFLNETILGGNYGSEQARNFQPLSVPRPAYNARFFEAFPTAWAGAYAFQKRLELGDPVAVEEWAALFLLDNFAVTHLAAFAQDVLVAQYDKDLWPALAGTYPQAEGLMEVKLLRTDNGTIIGAVYPNVIFFPSRGRYSWADDSLLKRFLDGTTLSWEKCSERLLRDDATRQRFHRHLRRLPLEGVFFNAMANFCNEKFGQAPPANGEAPFPRDPSGWTLADGRLRNEPVSTQTFLANYPLKRKRRRPGAPEGAPEGTVYYLVAGMPQTPDGWMTTSVMPGMPSPSQYRKGGDREITVEFRGERIRCPLAMEDEVVELKDCFIPEPAMCGIRSEAHAYKVRTLHKKSADGRGICSQVRVGDTLAVLLAPVNEKFLEHFPEVVADPDRYECEARRDLPGDGVTWKLKLHGKEVVWNSSPDPLNELANATLALWPPKVAADWNLYIAYGAGTRRETGVRWVLVGDEGATEKNVELADAEYASIIQGGKKPSRPRAMLLRDSQGEAAGVFFLKLAEESAVESRTGKLAVDFGTSNTCLAFETGGQPESLTFTLSPEMLWGEEPSDSPGVVPFNWAGKGGFYSTVLFSPSPKGHRVSDWGGDIDSIKDNIQIEHIVRVDIPSLHSKIEKPLSEGAFEDDWDLHDDLKWDPDTRKPWRSLFLGLSLLYAHAELFFKHRSKVQEYVFTYPLAFTQTERDLFIDDARQIVNKIRSFCYGPQEDVADDRFHSVDESTAVAKFIEATPNRETLELFIDTGGGTTDIALRYGNDFLVLDSIKVAGKTFFQFAEQNFKANMRGGSRFKKHLGNLLQDRDDQELDIPYQRLKLGTFYSLAINTLDDISFRRKEESILPPENGGAGGRRGMGEGSFQRYRTRLFFQHMLAYALVQAAAAAVARSLEVSNGVRLILGGNAWGLMAFAEMRRASEAIYEEAAEILRIIQRNVGPTLDEAGRECLEKLTINPEVQLLNKERLSEAKTAVSRGALTDPSAGADASGKREAQSYTGVDLKQVRINDSLPFDLRWFDLWGPKGLRQKTNMNVREVKKFTFEEAHDLQSPNPTLAVFTALGNSNYQIDPMSPQDWNGVNSRFQNAEFFVFKESLRSAPMNHFLSEVLYPEKKEHRLLNVLAQKNNSFENR